MRCHQIPALLITLGLLTQNVLADFIFGSGDKHVSASASDFTGSDSFDHASPIALGFDVLVDNADSPGDWTSSGSGALTDIGTAAITVSGDAMGHTSVEAGPPLMSALTEMSLTFTIDSTKLVNWFFLTLEPDGTFASITLTGPLGIVPAGDVALIPGEYTITASAGYTDFPILPGDATIHARYYGKLENIPAPASMVLLAFGGLSTQLRRRR